MRSKAEKFQDTIRQKQLRHKSMDGIKIVVIGSRKTALLFQDMFPANEHYIEQEYIKGGQQVAIRDKKVIQKLEDNTVKIIKLLRRGIRFAPIAPDILNIEKLMLEKLSETKESKKAVNISSTLILRV